MALLSEILNEKLGIPMYAKNEAASCCECGKKITYGGMWAMQKNHLGICKDCAPILLDWYIDALVDTGVINEQDDIKNVKKLSNDIIERYDRKKKKNNS